MREPNAEGVAPSRRGVAPRAGFLSPELDCLTGVSRTSLRNCELFIVIYGADGRGRSKESYVVGVCLDFQPCQDFSVVVIFMGHMSGGQELPTRKLNFFDFSVFLFF